MFLYAHIIILGEYALEITRPQTCALLAPDIREGVLSPGHSQPWLINGAVVVIECVSPAVEGGQTRHTAVYIECVFVPVLDAGLKASLKDPL